MEALGYEGYEVFQASNAVGATRVLNANSAFGVILCDLQMNGMDGLQLLRHLRTNYPQIPVIVTSAHSSDVGIGELARREAAHYLTKPFRITTLIDLIKRIASLPVS